MSEPAAWCELCGLALAAEDTGSGCDGCRIDVLCADCIDDHECPAEDDEREPTAEERLFIDAGFKP